MNVQEMFEIGPYALDKKQKSLFLNAELHRLTLHHRRHCEAYANILNATAGASSYLDESGIESEPFLPVRLFKMLELKSIGRQDVVKVLTSSGTTSQTVSKIFLDKQTAGLQARALVHIVKSFLGPKRLPMIIVDTPNVIKDRKSYSARGAGIMGMINFGRNHFYLLNDEMEADWEGLERFLKVHTDQKVLLFGFTFMVWKYFAQAAERQGKKVDLGDSLLIHSGGWKKLEEEAVDNVTFKKVLRERLGIGQIHNFYGMVEQVGSIFMECEHGHLHVPTFADVRVRDSETLEPLPANRPGLLQVLSVLPESYPGHSLLTEDIGQIHGEDDCPCGRKGIYFSVHGRLPRAEIRGCSDTHESV